MKTVDTFNQLNKSLTRRSVLVAVYLLILLFIIWTLRRNWSQIANYNWHVDYTLMSASIVLVVLTMLFAAVIWSLILSHFSQKLALNDLVVIWLRSQLAKYIPGGFWNLIGRAYLCQEYGVSTTDVILSLLLELTLLLIAQFFVILVLGSFVFGSLDNQIYILIIPILVGVVLTSPSVLRKGINVLARLRGEKVSLLNIQHQKIMGFLGLYIVFVILSGFTFYIFISSIHRLPISAFPVIVTIVTISFIAGFLNPLIPNGFGVREGILSLLLGQFVPFHVAVVIAFASRVWLIVGEVLVAGLGTLYISVCSRKIKTTI